LLRVPLHLTFNYHHFIYTLCLRIYCDSYNKKVFFVITSDDWFL